jgi:uncharacterized protein YgbK (DUF1537 family)
MAPGADPNPKPTAGKGGLRLAFYGDDFTGSTDALEVLAFAGVRCALFLVPPTRALLERFGALEAIGVAGDSRAMSPQEMDRHLPPLFDALAALHAPVIHYKVCSTFDSAPSIGSIGRVMEIARQRFTAPFIPIVAGTPALGRYCLFGHLFARSATDNRVYRIDRHPIMSVHPVTPMDESDLARHFGKQAALSIANLPFTTFDAGREAVDAQLRALADSRCDAVVLDAATPDHLTEVGRLLDRQARTTAPLFVVGSSGAEYALTQWWQQSEGARKPERDYDRCPGVDRVLALSGSASKLSAQQIDAAVAAGFAEVAVDARALVDDAHWKRAADELVAQATALLRRGRSVILHTARGPDDARIGALLTALEARGQTREQARHEGGRTLGVRLGHVAREILRVVPLQRLLLSGGDTSSQVTKVLAPDALVVAARLARGAPLCRFVSGDGRIDGLEVALKGGQMGDVEFFEKARRGNA